MLSFLEQGVISLSTECDAGYINGNQGRLTHHDKGGKINKKNENVDW